MKIVSTAVLFSLAGLCLAGCSNNYTSTINTIPNNASNTSITNKNIGAGSIVNTNSNNSNAANMNASNSSSQSADPQSFMSEAAVGGLAEIETGKLAISKAQNPEVKQFAQQMVADHTRANNELKRLADQKKVTIPTELDAAHKAMSERLSKISGAEFDKAYMEGQVVDHEKTVALFQTQSERGIDAEAKALATKTLPALKMHLEMAQKISGKLK